MFEIKSCPSCGSARIKRVRRDWTAEFRNRSYTVPNLEFYECPKCGCATESLGKEDCDMGP